MLTKEQFHKIFELIKKQKEVEDKFDKGMKMAFPECIAPIMPDGILWDALIDTLCYAMSDTDKFIEWWVYEDQMKGELTVMDNDVEYTFHNADELYDYLVKNNNQNNAS